MGNSCAKKAAEHKDEPASSAVEGKDRKGFRAGLVQGHFTADIWQIFDKLENLGHGMTGGVWHVRRKTTGEEYALKYMELRKINPDLLEDLKNEIELLKMLDHPNVIKLHEYYQDTRNLYLVLEFCDGGELYARLHEQEGNRYTEANAARLVNKMLSALAYIHAKNISHRDLKLENFIFEGKSEDSNIKLIDFGLSRKYGALKRMRTMVGTPYYIAPEILKDEGYTKACDLWSMGVIAYMLLSGTPPFSAQSDSGILQKVKKGKYVIGGSRWAHISDEAKDFIKLLLEPKASKRATAQAALQHAWVMRAQEATSSRALDPDILKSLRDFHHFSELKRAALEAIAFSTSAKAIIEMRRAFQSMDRDRTGFLSRAELQEVLQHHVSDEEISQLFKVIDQDQTGRVSYSEFLAATLNRKFYLNENRMREAFARLDVDGDGRITLENMRIVMGDDFDEARVRKMIDSADTKRDGCIDFEEFVAMMRREGDEIVKSIDPSMLPIDSELHQHGESEVVTDDEDMDGDRAALAANGAAQASADEPMTTDGKAKSMDEDDEDSLAESNGDEIHPGNVAPTLETTPRATPAQ